MTKTKSAQKRFREALIGILCGALIFGGPAALTAQSPQSAPTAAGSSPQTRSPSPTASAITDVALHNGVLSGQLVSEQGTPFADTPVYALRGNEVAAQSRTDENGWFQLSGLRGGVYRLQTPVGGGAYRVWSDNAAPPAARPHALLVSDGQVVLGQGTMRRILTSPWVWGVGIAAAIAIPLALANRDDNDKRVGS